MHELRRIGARTSPRGQQGFNANEMPSSHTGPAPSSAVIAANMAHAPDASILPSCKNAKGILCQSPHRYAALSKIENRQGHEKESN
jgi:hypothetical protein